MINTGLDWSFTEETFFSDLSSESSTQQTTHRKPLKIQGHRGGFQPENTMMGFRKAVQSGLDAIELDVSGTLKLNTPLGLADKR